MFINHVTPYVVILCIDCLFLYHIPISFQHDRRSLTLMSWVTLGREEG